MLTIWPRPPRLNGHTTRHHQQQSGPAATCPMMAACGVGCWVPSSTGWCRRRCRACARPRRGPGAVGGRSLWSAPAPAPVASCAALRRRSAVCGPGVLRPPIMPKRPCAFAPVRAARPSRCPLLALCGPGGFVRRSWPCAVCCSTCWRGCCGIGRAMEIRTLYKNAVDGTGEPYMYEEQRLLAVFYFCNSLP